jgi:polar amino acid transport system ATP-binding protein
MMIGELQGGGGGERRPVLEAVNITKRFGSNMVLDDVSLTVEKGEVLCILGPSGAGKSTLLRCMCHLDKQDSGAIFINGDLFGYKAHNGRLVALSEKKTCLQRHSIGMVFQSFNLFGHLTLLENIVEAPVRVLGLERSGVEARAYELLQMVGLEEKAKSYPGQLSGGQQQRGAIARALAMNPDVILFDEPTSALDPESIGGVISVMENLAGAKVTMVVVTHEIGFAKRAASRVVFMENGKIEIEGDVESTLINPRAERLRAFMSHISE